MRLACLGSGRSAQHSPFSTKKNENTASLCGDSHSLLCHSTSSYSTRIWKKEARSCCELVSHRLSLGSGFDDTSTYVSTPRFNRALFLSLNRSFALDSILFGEWIRSIWNRWKRISGRKEDGIRYKLLNTRCYYESEKNSLKNLIWKNGEWFVRCLASKKTRSRRRYFRIESRLRLDEKNERERK